MRSDVVGDPIKCSLNWSEYYRVGAFHAVGGPLWCSYHLSVVLLTGESQSASKAPFWLLE